MEKYDVFLSYSSVDRDVALDIKALLRANNKNIFLDAHDIRPGEKWSDKIEEAIASSELVMLLSCCDAALSQWVRKEYQQALSSGKSVAPVLLCKYELPEELMDYQWIDFTRRSGHRCEHSEPARVEPATRSEWVDRVVDDFRERSFTTEENYRTLRLVLHAIAGDRRRSS